MARPTEHTAVSNAACLCGLLDGRNALLVEGHYWGVPEALRRYFDTKGLYQGL